MAEYAYVVSDAVVEIKDISPTFHAQWVASGNPKAQSYLPIVNDPNPLYDPTIQVVESYFVVESSRVRRAWSVRPKTADELRKVWTSYEFLNRFTPTERAAIRTGSMSDPVLADFLMMSQAAQEVVSDDPITIGGLDYLVSIGILTAQRKAEILS
jgi:hypothetical protein